MDISGFNAAKVTNVSGVFNSCSKLKNITGSLNNLGEAYKTTVSASYSNYKLTMSECTQLTEQSLINMLNGLYDIATKGCNTQDFILGSTNIEKLTSEAGITALDNAIAKGWTIS